MMEIDKKDVQNWLLSELPGGEIAGDHVDSLPVSWWTCDCGLRRRRINGVCECPKCGGLDLGIQYAMMFERAAGD